MDPEIIGAIKLAIWLSFFIAVFYGWPFSKN